MRVSFYKVSSFAVQMNDLAHFVTVSEASLSVLLSCSIVKQ